MICNICSIDKDSSAYYGKAFRQCKECCRAKYVVRKNNPPVLTQEEVVQQRLEKEIRWRAAYLKRKEERAKCKIPLTSNGFTKSQEQRLKYLYGLTPEKYKALFDAQGGKCAICRNSGKLVVDHDHQTGYVRGLLHFDCNTAIGLFRDKPTSIRAAARYLEKSAKAQKDLRESTTSSEDSSPA